MFCTFNSFAGASELIDAEFEMDEIVFLEDVILDRLNNGGARADIKRDVTLELYILMLFLHPENDIQGSYPNYSYVRLLHLMVMRLKVMLNIPSLIISR